MLGLHLKLTFPGLALGLGGAAGFDVRTLTMRLALTPGDHGATEHLQQPADGVLNTRIAELLQLCSQLYAQSPQHGRIAEHQCLGFFRQQVFRCAVGYAFAGGLVGTERCTKDVADGRFGVMQ